MNINIVEERGEWRDFLKRIFFVFSLVFFFSKYIVNSYVVLRVMWIG